MFQNILVLCLGNICRSPIAERLLQEKSKAAGFTIKVDSAGLTAMVGDAAHPFSSQVMTLNGFNLEGHIAKQVTLEMVTAADLILVMDERQRHMLENKFAQASGKTYRLGHFSDYDIPDPYGKNESAFTETYQLIDTAVQDWLKQLH